MLIPDGSLWKEVPLEADDPLNAALLTILVIKHDLNVQLVGTAFLITQNGDHATAMTAAHCFEEVRRILHPNPPHHTSALPEFLPPPSEIDLKQVKALYVKGSVPYSCSIEISLWDNATDFAALTVVAPNGKTDLFRHLLFIDNQVPQVGELVAMIGFGEMRVMSGSIRPGYGRLQRKLVARVGSVEQVFPEGHLLLKGSCLQTSIAVLSGMSGGLVARLTKANTPIKPFAIISHAPEPQPADDCSKSGHSMASILSPRVKVLDKDKQAVEIDMRLAGIGKDKGKKEMYADFGFKPDEATD